MVKCPWCKREFSLVKKYDLTDWIAYLKDCGLSVREIAWIVKKGASTVMYHLKKAKGVVA